MCTTKACRASWKNAKMAHMGPSSFGGLELPKKSNPAPTLYIISSPYATQSFRFYLEGGMKLDPPTT